MKNLIEEIRDTIRNYLIKLHHRLLFKEGQIVYYENPYTKKIEYGKIYHVDIFIDVEYFEGPKILYEDYKDLKKVNKKDAEIIKLLYDKN